MTSDVPRPTALRVENDPRPANVATETPRFSWRVPTADRGARQSAYRLRVARSRAALDGGAGVVWDTGAVSSDRSTEIAYDGAPLGADETYVWQVTVWDGDGERLPDSDVASFGTALPASDWAGEWVAHQPGPGDANGHRSRWRPADADVAEWVQVDLGASRAVDEVALHPANPVDGPETPDGFVASPMYAHESSPHATVTATGAAGLGFPEGYRVAVADDPEFTDPTVVAERSGVENPGREPRTVDADARGRYVRVTATEPYVFDPFDPPEAPAGQFKEAAVRESYGRWQLFALAGLSVRGGDGTELARGAPVTASSAAETATWSRDYLVAGPDESAAASTSPLLRTELDLDGDVTTARAHVVGLGYGELYVNGERVGDAVLDPGWTEYDETVLYRTHDVTEQLRRGENALGLWLGRGWFAKSFYDWTGFGSPRARLHLTVEFADGTTRTLGTSTDWRACESPVVENDVFDGETYDARRERPGWADPGFDDGDWADAAAVEGPGGELRPQRIEPMRVVETVDPVEIHDHEDGPVVDFGQNLTGWVELDVSGLESGETVSIAHAEALTDDGDLATEDLRSAEATDAYVAGEDPDSYEPRFTYHGFRYAQVRGYPGRLDAGDLTAAVVHTAAPRTGSFACSSEELTRVQENCQWGMRGNLHSVPTDCPQRDERFGWTGDGRWTARPRTLNFDMQRAFEKWSRDHDDVQSRHGYVADTVPHGLGTVPEDTSWAITRVSVPWLLYRYYGDERVLEEHYEAMRRYVDYWYDVAEDGVVPESYGNYGDWLAFENREGNRGLPFELFNTATLLEATDRFARIASVLGHEDDAATYRARHETVAEGFNDRFFDAEAGRYEPGTQAAQAVPLFRGIVPAGREDEVVAALVEAVHDAGDRLRTGFLSTPALLDVLSRNGHLDLAHEVVSQPEKPGWVYMVRNGATTLWEHWDSDEQVGSGMNSLNHPSFSSVSAWFVERLAGVRPGDGRGYEHVEIDPGTDADLDWAAASVDTRRGEAGVRWARTEGGLTVEATVPWNATATVRLPGGADALVAESGVPVWDGGPVEGGPDGVEDAARDGEAVVLEVRAGEYAFDVAE